MTNRSRVATGGAAIAGLRYAYIVTSVVLIAGWLISAQRAVASSSSVIAVARPSSPAEAENYPKSKLQVTLSDVAATRSPAAEATYSSTTSISPKRSLSSIQQLRSNVRGGQGTSVQPVADWALPSSTPTVTSSAAVSQLAAIEQFQLSLVQGWNLVSIPVEPSNPARSTVFPPPNVSTVWEYGNPQGYRVPAQIHAKKGYWVKALNAATVTVTGARPTDHSVAVKAGWNLIGPVGQSSTSPIQPLPPTPPVTTIWQFINPAGYQAPTSCVDGRGYSVNASQAAVLWQTTPPSPEYFVSVNGLDTNGGTLAAPWRTIAHGLSSVHPGDTLHILPGTYAESNEISGKQGTASAPITIKGDPETIVHATGRDGFLVWNGSSYLIFDGLEVTGGTRSGILISIGANNVVVRNCHIHDNTVWQIQTALADHITVENCELNGSVTQHGIYFSTTDYPVARGNRIHNNAGCGIHMNGDLSEGGDGLVTGAVITGNTIYECGTSGGAAINMDSAENALVADNLVYDNHAGGITSFCIDGLRAGTGNRFYNNTLYFPSGGRYGLQLVSGSQNATVENNIFISANAALEIDSDSLPGLVSDFNIFVRPGSTMPIDNGTRISLTAWLSSTGHDSHSFSDMPTFVNVGADDYHLQAASIGVDDGVTVSGVTTDIAGTARPQGVAADIGAYER